MCATTGICGVIVGLLELVIAIGAGGAACIGLVGISGIGVCGVMSFFIFAVCMLGVNAILGVLGFGLLDVMAGGMCGGYLGYFGTFIDQGGNLYDACRICVAGK